MSLMRVRSQTKITTKNGFGANHFMAEVIESRKTRIWIAKFKCGQLSGFETKQI